MAWWLRVWVFSADKAPLGGCVSSPLGCLSLSVFGSSSPGPLLIPKCSRTAFTSGSVHQLFLSLDIQIPCSLTSQPPPGLCSKLTSHVRFCNFFSCLPLLHGTCHYLRHLISCLLLPYKTVCTARAGILSCLCIAVFSVPREDVTHKK